ncbi:coproporphyrinogen III oxidase [Vallitalea longa]|uniref:Coproporphyrinogen III oxidase n=1 Tax=Vallitalea longa TaxID=2936439 RepID=A0A9W6DFF4_9FIRM|nr:coproporphyrinogen dehydrogenase HemZ [Vallitalea longa]GKX29388.1 coproporphyrinogen III oxidase [Vallitalea longa]
MFLLLKGHNYEYEIKMLLNLFFHDEHYEIVESVSREGITIETIICDEYFKAVYYENGKVMESSSFDKKYIDELPKEPLERRKETKKSLKILIYNIVSKVTGKSQPWGILTGIRPTKIVFDLIDKYGFNEEKIKWHLANYNKISPLKINLMMEIARNEIKTLNTNKDNEINIYIGIPFCPTRCLYCSFTSYPIDKWKSHVADYLEALNKEMRYVSKELLKGKKVKTIYVGGGTPTSLNEEQLDELMLMIDKNFNVNMLEEFSVEAGRPDTINVNKLNILKKYGVTRISINPQTMNDRTLKIIGRRHTVEDIYTAFAMARKVGFDNINMDLILGLPEETYDDVKNTMSQIKRLSPESLTVHTMAVKRASRLKETINKYHLTTDIEIQEMIDMVYHESKSMGLEPYYMYRQKNMVGNYENVGYCVKGKECIYNIEIMEEAQSIIALGAGSVSKIVYKENNRIERIENVKDVGLYIDRIDEMIDRKTNELLNK